MKFIIGNTKAFANGKELAYQREIDSIIEWIMLEDHVTHSVSTEPFSSSGSSNAFMTDGSASYSTDEYDIFFGVLYSANFSGTISQYQFILAGYITNETYQHVCAYYENANVSNINLNNRVRTISNIYHNSNIKPDANTVEYVMPMFGYRASFTNRTFVVSFVGSLYGGKIVNWP